MKLMIFRLYMNFDELIFNHCAITNTNQRTEGPESRTDGETLIFWD